MSAKIHHHHSSRPTARGSVIIVVLWAIAIAALVTTSVQLFSHRQATLGREALERVQARWAARAGMEDIISVMRDYTERPDPDDPQAMVRAMGNVSQGDTIAASYDVRHQVDGRDIPGPMDEHSKLNINKTEDRGMLMVLDDMQYDIYDAITDWIDSDNQPSALGVENDWYQGQKVPIEPRNGPLHTTAEMELIAGVWPQYFRGEDWNLDNRLDANENDGRRSLPPDNGDGRLDAGWFGAVTVYSVTGGATVTGKPRIHLKEASSTDLIERFQLAGAPITEGQAQYLINFGRSDTNRLESLLSQPTNAAGGTGGPGGAGGSGGNGRNGGAGATGGTGGATAGQTGGSQLSAKQAQVAINETSVESPYDRKPGKMNINTVPAWLLRDMLNKGMSLDESVADEIIYMRQSNPEGIVHLQDLTKIPQITPQMMDQLSARFGTSSNVYTISSRGRSWASGVEVEIVAVVDRSSIPVRIIEYREQ